MSIPVIIAGKSGSGKSCSLINCNPKTTAIINILSKELPFKNSFEVLTKENNGTIINTDEYAKIKATLQYISDKRPEITLAVIDDSTYIMVDHFMREHHNGQAKGNAVFALYNDIGDEFWNLLQVDAKQMRKDLIVVFLHHTELNELSEVKLKTIGKMLDEKVDICGLVTICLLAKAEPDGHFFYTSNNGNSIAKTPIGMFKEEKIPNDLNVVVKAIQEYYLPAKKETKTEKKAS